MHFYRKKQCPPLILPVLLMLAGMALGAPHPQLINYQGRIAADGINFDGIGHFKFALVDATGTTTHWSNDGTSTAGSEPAAAAPLSVSKGQYTVLLGDANLPAMAAIPDGILNQPGRFLRVWFNDGMNGSQQLHPDQPITATAPGNSRKARDGRAETTGDYWQQRMVVPAPAGRQGHTAVWTGSEMVVWGGSNNGGLNTGGRYSPAANHWTAMSTTDAPLARAGHTAVWTGSEMIVWGGSNSFGAASVSNTGGSYHPAENLWTAMTTSEAPTGRTSHTAVWTGREMIVWGGLENNNGTLSITNTGGRYDPAENLWRAVASSGAPSGRVVHSAVWTGNEMLIWGGSNGSIPLKSGARYDPAGDRWTSMTTVGAPSERSGHTAVWTGSEMLIWGGSNPNPLNTGGRYDPANNRWNSMTIAFAPSQREAHTAVWTGSEMIVWGGYTGLFTDTGGRYDPAENRWNSIPIASAPSQRMAHTAVWTGSGMIVWGGSAGNPTNTGGRYDPAENRWTPTDISRPLTQHSHHTAVWTGSEVIVWGGFNAIPLNTGSRYDPALNYSAELATTDAPPGRWYHTAAWTGRRMIVWGGLNAGGYLNSGALYDPVADDWTTASQSNAPSPRLDHTAVWTNRGMVVWGGYSDTYLNDGGRYDPDGNTWTFVNSAGAPRPRGNHTAVWTGQDMIVWGGVYFDGSFHSLNDGGRYHPADDTWADINRSGAPAVRHYHTALWSGKEMIVWGGFGNSARTDGGRYDPAANLWTAVSNAGAPPARWLHTAVWTGRGMIVWGGFNGDINLNTGGHYDAAADRWTAVTTLGAPPARQWHTSLWTGSRMIVQGGLGGGSSGYFNDIFSYSPGYAAFQITHLASIGGNILLDFPSVTGHTYTLWHSDNPASGPWTESGLPPLAGTGSTLTFTIHAPSDPRRFYRIKADP